MSTKHTKGPWNIEFEAEKLAMNGIGNYSVNGPKGIICRTEESTIEETEANARLIAAAPELLEACREFLESGPNGYDIDLIDKVKRAIAKAQGGAK